MMKQQTLLLGLLGGTNARIRVVEQASLSSSPQSSLHQSASSADGFLRRMVALLIIGRAQKPTLRTHPNVT